MRHICLSKISQCGSSKTESFAPPLSLGQTFFIKMSERNRQVLNEIKKKPGNDVCADCKSNDEIEWASCNLGIFLCKDCAQIHRSLGVDISRVKSMRYDNWSDEHVKEMAELGNDLVNQKYEQHLPKYYKRPTKDDAEVIRMQFIRAKYERKEFMYQDKQMPYCSNKKEGKLFKRMKKNEKFLERRFTINSRESNMMYYNRETARQPKDIIPLDETNVVFVPDKMNHPNGFQVTYLKNDKTRNLFLYSEDSKDAIDWFTAIRSAKLERRTLAFPDRDENELCKDLTQNFLMEGYLEKQGPKREPYRKRWFTLDKRKLMYLDYPLAPYPLGEIFIGYKDDKFKVESNSESSNEFVLKTPDRDYYLKADSLAEKGKWMVHLQSIIETQPTPPERRQMYTVRR